MWEHDSSRTVWFCGINRSGSFHLFIFPSSVYWLGFLNWFPFGSTDSRSSFRWCMSMQNKKAGKGTVSNRTSLLKNHKNPFQWTFRITHVSLSRITLYALSKPLVGKRDGKTVVPCALPKSHGSSITLVRMKWKRRIAVGWSSNSVAHYYRILKQ